MSDGKRILVIEDDEDLRRLYRIALSFEGFDVDEARSGFEALRILDSRQPDLVVLDLMLPGVDGLTVHQEIAAHAFLRHIPIVVVTASAGDLSDMKVDCVLRKPIAPEELVATVRQCLTKGAPSAGA